MARHNTQERPGVTLEELEKIRMRRRIRKPMRADVALHSAAGAAYTIWKNLPRLFPRYSLLNEEATRFAICRIPMQVKRRGKNTWWVFGGFAAYDELQELETSTLRLPVQLQEYKKISDPQVEAVSLILLLHDLRNYALDGAVALEQLRRLIKTSFSQAARKLVLAIDTSSRQSFARRTGVSDSKLKRQAARLKASDPQDTSFIHRILAEN
jgi:hypothetical protein